MEQLLSALRGGANEVGEAIVDSQALRILDQEIRDADVELRKSREALASIMARHRLAQERVEKGAAQVAEYEQYAIKALEAGNEELAREVAEKIATLENQLEGERAQVAEFAASVAQLRKSVSQAEGNIRQLKQQVDTVKATESVQKAQMAVAQRYGNSKSKLQTAVDSLERIKQRQAERAATMDAAAELASAAAPDDALDAKLRAPGIKASGNSVDGVLARLKERARPDRPAARRRRPGPFFRDRATMEGFLQTALSFPTVLFSFLLILAIIYWGIVALGMVEIDVLDLDAESVVDGAGQAEGLAALLAKLKLNGVPVTLVLTLLSFFAWFLCYFVQLWLLSALPLGWLRYPLGAVVAVGALFLAAPLAATLCRPLRPLFRKLESTSSKSVLGQVAVVRSGRVTLQHGEALLEDGGAGLILKVRAEENKGFKRGDRVVLLEYLEAEHAYRVVTEEEFRGI